MDEPTEELPRSRWHAELEELTRRHEGHRVTIELLDHEFGDEEEAESLPLAYVDFDPKDDVFIVAVGGREARFPVVLRHMVEHPERITADSFGDGRSALEVVDDEGNHTIVTIAPPAGTEPG